MTRPFSLALPSPELDYQRSALHGPQQGPDPQWSDNSYPKVRDWELSPFPVCMCACGMGGKG